MPRFGHLLDRLHRRLKRPPRLDHEEIVDTFNMSASTNIPVDTATSTSAKNREAPSNAEHKTSEEPKTEKPSSSRRSDTQKTNKTAPSKHPLLVQKSPRSTSAKQQLPTNDHRLRSGEKGTTSVATQPKAASAEVHVPVEDASTLQQMQKKEKKASIIHRATCKVLRSEYWHEWRRQQKFRHRHRTLQNREKELRFEMMKARTDLANANTSFNCEWPPINWKLEYPVSDTPAANYDVINMPMVKRMDFAIRGRLLQGKKHKAVETEAVVRTDVKVQTTSVMQYDVGSQTNSPEEFLELNAGDTSEAEVEGNRSTSEVPSSRSTGELTGTSQPTKGSRTPTPKRSPTPAQKEHKSKRREEKKPDRRKSKERATSKRHHRKHDEEDSYYRLAKRRRADEQNSRPGTIAVSRRENVQRLSDSHRRDEMQRAERYTMARRDAEERAKRDHHRCISVARAAHRLRNRRDGWEKLGLYEYFKAKERATAGKKIEVVPLTAEEKADKLVKAHQDKSGSSTPERKENKKRSRERGRSSRSRSRSYSPYRRPRRESNGRSRSRSRSGSRSKSKGSPSPEIAEPTTSILPPKDLTFSDSKLGEMNKGHQLLKKMGWSGKGLGAEESGIEEPVSAGEVRERSELYKGLGLSSTEEEDPFEQFRKNRAGQYIQRLRSAPSSSSSKRRR